MPLPGHFSVEIYSEATRVLALIVALQPITQTARDLPESLSGTYRNTQPDSISDW